MSIISRLSYFEYDNNSILTLLRDTLCNIEHLAIDIGIGYRSKKKKKHNRMRIFTEQTGKHHDETCTQINVNRFNV